MNEDFGVVETTLIKYSGEDEEVKVPEGITKINDSAFWGLENIESVILPGTIEAVEIGYSSLYCLIRKGGGHDNLSERCRGRYDLYKKMPEWSLSTIGKLTGSIAELIRKNWLSQMTPHYWALLYLTQITKEFRELFCMHMGEKPGDCLEEMTKLLKEYKKPGAVTRAALYAAEHHKELKKELIEKLYALIRSYKNLKSAREIAEMLLYPKKIDKSSPYAWLYEAFDEPKLLKLYKDYNGKMYALNGVLSKDGSGRVPRIAVLAAVVPYMEFFDKERRCSYTSSKVKILPDSDRAAEMISRASLINFIEENADIKKSTRWLYPYCRYAGERDIQNLILSQMTSLRERRNDYFEGMFRECVLPSNALMLSDTCGARLALNEGTQYIRRIEQYARIRGKLEDAVITDMGLDEHGKISYESGNKKLTAFLTDDFKLKLSGEKNAADELIREGGNDRQFYYDAEFDVNRRSEYLKQVVEIRTRRLLRDFLSGKALSFEEWKTINFATAVNKLFAEKLIWTQDGKTFTVKDGMLINSAAEEYAPADSPVKLAHPMDMSEEEICAWRYYFKRNGTEQPFTQIEEPVCNLHEIEEDRYMGAVLPLYKFMRRGADGILYNDPDHYTMSVDLKDCAIKYEFIRRHGYWGDYDHIEIYNFVPEMYGRQANHIVSLLDDWAAEEFIKKDDMSACRLLGNTSAERLEEFTSLAIESKAKNMTAKLLEIKKDRFPESRDLDEFTLGDW